MSPPDPEDEKQEPVSRDSSEMDPNERQFWDLDEDEDLLEDPAPAAGPADEPVAEAVAGDDAGHIFDEDLDDGPAPDTGDGGDSGDAPTRKGQTTVEKVSLGVFAVLLLSLGIWAGLVFLNELPTEDPEAPADLPVKGKQVVIKNLETYWRKPDSDRDRGVQASVKIIPATEISLGKGDGSGALRVFFEDDNGRLTGDPVTLPFSNGTFTGNGTKQVEAYCTEGFTGHGDFPAYVTGQTERWFLIVKEGPSASARGAEFVEILRTPITPDQR